MHTLSRASLLFHQYAYTEFTTQAFLTLSLIGHQSASVQNTMQWIRKLASPIKFPEIRNNHMNAPLFGNDGNHCSCDNHQWSGSLKHACIADECDCITWKYYREGQASVLSEIVTSIIRASIAELTIVVTMFAGTPKRHNCSLNGLTHCCESCARWLAARGWMCLSRTMNSSIPNYDEAELYSCQIMFVF